MKKLYHTITYIGLALSFGIILLMFYWAVIDGVYVNKVLNVDSITYTTNKTAYHKGDELSVTVDGLCKYRSIAPDTYINLVDTIYYPYEVKKRYLPVGCNTFGKLSPFVELPKGVPVGTYHLSGIFSYDINPIRSGSNAIKVPFTTNEFQIVD